MHKILATLSLNYKDHHGFLMHSISLVENHFLALPMRKYNSEKCLTH